MSLPRFQPLELSISYDQGKMFRFYEIPNTTYGQYSYNLQDVVTLEVNFGSGLVTIFSGRVKSRQHIGENNNEGIIYSVAGMHQLADEVSIVNVLGQPQYLIQSALATLVTTATYTTLVRDAITEVFSVNGTRLQSFGIPVAYTLDGISETAYVDKNLTLQGGFFSALKELASFDPGVKVFFDDTEQRWKFINVFQANTSVVDLNVNSINLRPHTYEISTAERYTAINLYDDGTLASNTDIGTPVNFGTYQLFPVWNTDLESSWTRELGSHPLLSDGESYNPYYDVFRTFVVAWKVAVPYGADILVQIDGNVEFPLDGSVQVWFKPYGFQISNTGLYQTDASSSKRRMKTVSSSSYGPARYLPSSATDPFSSVSNFGLTYSKVSLVDRFGFDRVVGVQAGNIIQTENGGIVVRMAEPLAWGNTDFPGAAMSPVANDLLPSGVFATWFYSEQIQTVPILQTPVMRFPATGYTGEAYSIGGVINEKSVYVPKTKLNAEYAARLLQLYSGFVVSGTLQIEGDILQDFIGLNRKVILRDSTKITGIQSVTIPVIGYTYTFGKTGVSNLVLNSDLTSEVRL